MSKTVVYGIFSNLGKVLQILNILGLLAGVAPGIEDFIAEAVEGQIALQPVLLRHHKVSDGPSFWLGKWSGPMEGVKAGNRGGGAGIKYAQLE